MVVATVGDPMVRFRRWDKCAELKVPPVLQLVLVEVVAMECVTEAAKKAAREAATEAARKRKR